MDVMRIIVDGKNLTKPISGISRYLVRTANFLAKNGLNVKIVVPGAIHSDHVLSHDIELIIIGRNTLIDRIRWLAHSLGDYVNHEKPDLFWGPAHRIPLNLSLSIPSVVTCHDLVCIKHGETMKLNRRVADRIFLPMSMSRATAIHTVSVNTLTEVKTQFPQFRDKSFSTLPHACTRKLSPQISTLEGEQQGFGLFVGTFEPRKNLKNLIFAYDDMCERSGLDPGLILAGADGWGKTNIEEQLIKLRKKRDIKIVRAPTDKQLSSLYRRCRFVVLTSFYEGLGLPIIEAKEFGKPTIISKIGSLVELADRGSLEVNPKSMASISHAMQKFFYDEGCYQKALAIAQSFEQKFDWEENSKQLVKHFLRISFK